MTGKQNHYTTLEGGHVTVSETAMALKKAGKCVRVLNDRTTSEISPNREYEIKHYDNHTVIIDANTEIVQVEINDESEVTVRPNGVGSQ